MEIDNITTSLPPPSPALSLNVNPHFRFLDLPRELRDEIYDYVFTLPDSRSSRALRIERRHLTYFIPTPASILTVLHHEDLLWNRQTAREALEVLFKRHRVFLSCGPYVLMKFLKMIEEGVNINSGRKLEEGKTDNGTKTHVGDALSLANSLDPDGKTVLGWLKRIELDWVTFPNLKFYPPWRWDDRYLDDGSGTAKRREVDIEGTWNFEGESSEYYDDNYYDDRRGRNTWPDQEWEQYYEDAQDAEDAARQPSNGAEDPSSSEDPFGWGTHYPFTDPALEPQHDASTPWDARNALDRLVAGEVTPLFQLLSARPIALTSITLPLFFISREKYQSRALLHPDALLPLRVRYWTKVATHALLMLLAPDSHHCRQTLEEVRIKYSPYDIWASLEPTDDLETLAEKGLWDRKGNFTFREGGEGAAFKALHAELEAQGVELGPGIAVAETRFVAWELEAGDERAGNQLEVVVRRRGG